MTEGERPPTPQRHPWPATRVQTRPTQPPHVLPLAGKWETMVEPLDNSETTRLHDTERCSFLESGGSSLSSGRSIAVLHSCTSWLARGTRHGTRGRTSHGSFSPWQIVVTGRHQSTISDSTAQLSVCFNLYDAGRANAGKSTLLNAIVGRRDLMLSSKTPVSPSPPRGESSRPRRSWPHALP